MVKVLLSLKWQYFLASFKSNAWVIVGVIFGGLYALGLLAGWGIAAVAAGSNEPGHPTNAMLAIMVGVVLSLLWWLLPIFTSGSDATLDPDHLVPYPLKTRDIQLGQLFGGLIGIIGFSSLLFALLGALLFWKDPLALVVYLATVPLALGLILCISRLMTLVVLELEAIPGFKQTVIIIAFLALMGMGPIIAVLTAGLMDVWEQLPEAVDILAWTPLGAPLAVASAVYMGDWGKALVLLVLALVYLALAWWAWSKLLNRARNKSGAGSATPSSKAVQQGNLGIFKHFPATARGAIAARTVHMLIKDPRCNLNIIMIPAMYLLFTLFGNISVGDGGSNPVFTVFAAIFVPAMAGYVYCYLISYENSAFSLHVLAPLKGKDDRLGRAWGLLSLMLPLVVLGSIFLSWRTDGFASLPLMLGLGVGMLFSGIGVSAFIDMFISLPVPPPGGNPLKMPKQSDGFAKTLVRSLIMLVLLAFAIPGGIFWIIYLVGGNSLFMWLGAFVSLLVGALVMWVGLSIGSKRYETHADATLQRVTRVQ